LRYLLNSTIVPLTAILCQARGPWPQRKTYQGIA